MGALRDMRARRFFIALVGVALAWSHALAQEGAGGTPTTDLSADTLKVAKELSAESGVPLSTVLTDLVTKGSSLQVESGLGSVPEMSGVEATAGKRMWVPKTGFPSAERGVRSDNSRSEYLDSEATLDSPVAEVAMDRGYTPRTIELDSRFEENVSRAASASVESPETNGRVFGGIRILEPDPFLDVVAITGNHRICSGTLIAPDKVLTAAHCYCDGIMDEVTVGQSILSPIERIPVDKEHSEVFRECGEINRDLGIGDVALLKLARRATPQPRSLTSMPTIKGAASVRAVGFGKTESESAGFKYMVDIVIASYQCDGSALTGIPDHQIYNCQPKHELVAAALGRDTCGGDSGGPVFVFGADNKPYIAGITSRAVTGRRCGPGGIYVIPAVEPIREWLEARGVSFP